MAADPSAFFARVDRSGDHHLWRGAKTARNAGQLRVDGKLRTAAQVAWELEHGSIPEGFRVGSCADESLCVRIDHLTLRPYAKGGPVAKRSSPGGGTIRELGADKWKLTMSVGRDDDDKHRRVSRTVRGTKADASRALAAFSVEVQTGQKRPAPPGAPLTVNELVEWYLDFASEERGLEHSTVVGYGEVYDMWLRDQIGHTRAERLSPADLDRAFGKMRRKGLSRSRMINARAAVAGAYKWGRRHGKVSNNPTVGFELPTSMHIAKNTSTPELDELLTILADANHNDLDLAPVLTLAATTGMRRGELSGLRRDRLHLDKGELTVDHAVNDAGGIVVIKTTKTRQTRTVSLDPATLTFLREHLDTMDKRAAELGCAVADDAYVFSLEPDCASPMRPEFMTRRMRVLRKRMGLGAGDFDATILAMRKWTTTELMDAGFNPSAVSGRQGHTVQVMLEHYSSRRRSADQAAAEHLGSRVHQRAE